MEHYPKDILGFQYDPRRVFFHIVTVLKNEPGALSDLATRLAGAKLNILTSFSSARPDAPDGIWSAFVESKDGMSTPEAAKRVVDASKFVKESEVAMSEKGFIADKFHFPLRYSPGRRAIILGPDLMSAMFEHILRTFGSGGKVILYQEGLYVGKAEAQAALFGLGGQTAEGIIDKIYPLYQAVGWGIIEVESGQNLEKFRVRVRENFECIDRKSKEPMCHFIRRVFAGAHEAILGAEVSCAEEICAAQGNEYCQFLLERKPG